MDAPPVQYVATGDGYSLAYCISGEGLPLVFMPLGFNHVQLAWTHDGRVSDWLRQLATHFQLVQYDGRAQGMSTRGLPMDYSMDDRVRELEALVDDLHLARFVLVASFYSGHVAVRYAVKHPDRVLALVLIACSVSMEVSPVTPSAKLADANWDLVMHNWVPIPCSPDERDAYVALFRQTVTHADHVISTRAFETSSVEALLPQVRTPTLVLHPRDYLWLDVEEATRLAASIQGARLTILDGGLRLGEAAEGVPAIEKFLASLEQPAPVANRILSHGLSPREIEVLCLLAAGKSSREIGEALVLSVRTVERHIANIYIKTETHGRAQIAVYARDRGLV